LARVRAHSGASLLYRGHAFRFCQSSKTAARRSPWALIGLVFASLRASTLASACAQRRIALLLENEIKNVRQTLAQQIHSLPVSDAELDRSLEALTMLSRIEYAGLAMIGAICLYHLGIATVYGAAYQELLGLH